MTEIPTILIDNEKITDLPGYMNKKLNDGEFLTFNKQDNSEISVAEVVELLKGSNTTDGKS